MRPLLIAFALLLSLLATAQESMLWVDPSIEEARPDDLNYLAAIKGRSRSFDVLLHQLGAIATRRQRVTVKGALTKAQVADLLQSVLGADKSYWGQYPTAISVVGDEHRAKISTIYVCGDLCGSGMNYLYTYEGNVWRYLYSFNRWFS
jgi:hypothetical protein